MTQTSAPPLDNTTVLVKGPVAGSGPDDRVHYLVVSADPAAGQRMELGAKPIHPKTCRSAMTPCSTDTPTEVWRKRSHSRSAVSTLPAITK